MISRYNISYDHIPWGNFPASINSSSKYSYKRHWHAFNTDIINNCTACRSNIFVYLSSDQGLIIFFFSFSKVSSSWIDLRVTHSFRTTIYVYFIFHVQFNIAMQASETIQELRVCQAVGITQPNISSQFWAPRHLSIDVSERNKIRHSSHFHWVSNCENVRSGRNRSPGTNWLVKCSALVGWSSWFSFLLRLLKIFEAASLVLFLHTAQLFPSYLVVRNRESSGFIQILLSCKATED